MILRKYFPPLLSVFIITCFLGFIAYFSTGIPQADDYPMMFQFLDKWDMAFSFRDKYTLLTEQFLDHRMLAMKLTVLSVKGIFGKMNINAVNAVGVVIWLSTVYILYRAFKASGYTLLAFLPILLLTLHPGFGFDGLLWAATWMAFPWVIFFCLTSFYCLVFHEKKIAFILALALSCFAMFSHGNGILCCLIGFMVLIAQKKYRLSGVWAGISACCLLLFFYHYKSGGTSETSPLINVIERPLYVIFSIGAFTGGSMYFPDIEVTDLSVNNLPAIIFGLLISLLILSVAFYTFLVRSFFRDNYGSRFQTDKLLLFLSAIGIFIIATAVMISCVRTSSEVLHGFAARYHFYSALLISVTFMLLTAFLPSRISKAGYNLAAIFLGLTYCAGQYWYQTVEVADHVRIYEAGLYNSRNNGQWVLYKDARFWERGVNKYSNEHIWPHGSENYSFPKVQLIPEQVAGLIHPSMLSGDNHLNIVNGENTISVWVKGSSFQIPAISDNVDGVYVNLVSKNKSFLYPLRPERAGLRQFVKTGVYYKPDLKIHLQKKWFAPGIYRLNIFVRKNGKKWMLNTNRVVEIRQYPFEV